MTVRLPGEPASPWARPKPVDPVYRELVERARASAARELLQPQPAQPAKKETESDDSI